MALVKSYRIRNVHYLWMSNFLCLPFQGKKLMFIWFNWLHILDAEELWPPACNVHSLFSSCPFAMGWRKYRGTGESLIWLGKAMRHSCTEAALLKLTNLSFWFCQNRCVNGGWRTRPTNMNAVWSWIQPLQPAASKCGGWLALFYVANMRQLQAVVIVNFHMAKLLVWKGHQKKKI